MYVRTKVMGNIWRSIFQCGLTNSERVRAIPPLICERKSLATCEWKDGMSFADAGADICTSVSFYPDWRNQSENVHFVTYPILKPYRDSSSNKCGAFLVMEGPTWHPASEQRLPDCNLFLFRPQCDNITKDMIARYFG